MMTAPRRPVTGQEYAPGGAKPGGVALIAAGAGAVVVVWLERRRMSLGFNDADDPGVMLAFFRERPHLYTATGAIWMVIGVALVVAAVVLWRAVLAPRPSTVVAVGSVFGLVSGAFFFAQGVLRLNTPGTVLHIADLDQENGEAAYAAVQMAGTQGFGSTGGFALAVWATAVALGTWRSRALPRAVAVLAVLPATLLVIVLLGGFFKMPEATYLLYVAAVTVGLPLWCVGLGAALLRVKSSGRA